MGWVNEFDLVLPSGNVAKLKRIDLLSLLVRKRGIPEVLLPIVDKQINPRKAAKKAKADEELGIDSNDDAEMSLFLDWLCTKVFVSPKAVEEEIDIPNGENVDEYVITEQISLEDKTYVLAWEMGGESGVAAMEFRKKASADVANVYDGEVIRETSV